MSKEILAFPSSTKVFTESATGEIEELIMLEKGMTLRDYFAAHAPEVPKWFYEAMCDGKEIADQRCIAMWRYSYADAMLKERDK